MRIVLLVSSMLSIVSRQDELNHSALHLKIPQTEQNAKTKNIKKFETGSEILTLDVVKRNIFNL